MPILVQKISAILLKYPTFEGGFFSCPYGQKKFLQILVFALKSLSIAEKKVDLLALKCTFLCPVQSIVDEKE